VAMMQMILSHCEFGVGIEYDEVCIVAGREPSFASAASGELRRFI